MQAAVELAAAHEAHLTGVYVIADPSPAVFASGHVPPEVLDSLQQRAREHAEAALARFAEVAGRNQIAFETRIDRVLYTEVADALADQRPLCRPGDRRPGRSGRRGTGRGICPRR